MISPLTCLASSNASLLLPAPVGPDITITFCRLLFIEQEVVKSLVLQRRRKIGRAGRWSGASAG